MIKKYNEHIAYLEEHDDPNGIVQLVGLPSGEYSEIKRKYYYKIQNIATWSERYKCYTYRDKDYHKIMYLLDSTIYVKNHNDDHISAILDNMKIKNYKINNGKIKVFGDVELKFASFNKIPIKFHEVTGNFIITYGAITTLENCPEFVGGSFIVCYNRLTDLKGGPREVKLSYDCSFNYIESLYGCPLEVWDFNCSNNSLKDLKYGPSHVHYNFNCSNNNIIDIKDSPDIVGGIFDCSENELKDLTGKPKNAKIISTGNPLKDEELELTRSTRLFKGDEVVFYDEKMRMKKGICSYDSDFLRTPFSSKVFFGKFTLQCYVTNIQDNSPNRYIYYNDYKKCWVIVKVEDMI